MSALLVKDSSLIIHQKNLILLAIEIFKVKITISPEIMNDIFDFSKNYGYGLRCGNFLSRSNIHSINFGIESIANIAAKVWNKIPNEIKEAWHLILIQVLHVPDAKKSLKKKKILTLQIIRNRFSDRKIWIC